MQFQYRVYIIDYILYYIVPIVQDVLFCIYRKICQTRNCESRDSSPPNGARITFSSYKSPQNSFDITICFQTTKMQRIFLFNMVFMIAFAFTDRPSGGKIVQDKISSMKMSQVRNEFIRKTKNGICPETCVRQKLEISLVDFLDELDLRSFHGIAPFDNQIIDIGYCTGHCTKSQPKTIRQKLMDINVRIFIVISFISL